MRTAKCTSRSSSTASCRAASRRTPEAEGINMRKLLIFSVILASCAHQAPVKQAPVAAQPVKAAPPPRLIDVPPAILYKESRELMAQGNWDAAKARIDAYLAREPKSAAALFDAGWVSEKRGDPGVAADYYKRALES